MSKIDLTGQKFGKLIVIRESEIKKNNKRSWICRCECGTEKVITTSNLRNGNTKSCGCLKRKKQQEWGASTLRDLTGEKFR